MLHSYDVHVLHIRPNLWGQLGAARVWKQGTGNLKQLVIEWCQHHPAFAGLELGEWCMRLKDDDRPVLPGLRQPTVYKFCLECTP